MIEREDTLHDLAELAMRFMTSDKRLGHINAQTTAEAICEQIRLLWGGQPVYLKSTAPDDHAAANSGDSFLADVTETAADTFQQAGVSATDAREAAKDLAEQTRRLLSSQPVYIRKLDASHYAEKYQAIRNEFDGNHKKKRELCLKYGIGYHRLQQILNAVE